ncbi:MAG: CapA family protein [Rhodobacter sp.]|nr:CapA family protein [Rhodobacter sp.]
MFVLRWLATLLGLLIVASGAAANELVITFGGDVNFARSRQAPSAEIIRKFGVHPLAETTETLRQEWDGDVNFVNVETAVAERDGAPQWGKTFVFRSHPDQFRHLIGLGVNAFALANNHAFDHGRPGLRQTLDFFRSEDSVHRPLLYAGAGAGDQAFHPKVITVHGIRIALSAVSFGNGRFSPGPGQVGMAYLFHADHYDRVLDGLKEVDADIKLLSVHYGTENQISLNAGQAALYRRAVEEAGVHLVIGHHPHVVRGVEVSPRNNAAIFYSLGNLLFIGGAGKDAKGLGQDYGLLGRAYFSVTRGKTRLRALEAVPLKGVHLVPRRPPSGRAAATIAHLNRLSERSVGNRAASFTVTGAETPRGLACYGGPYGPRAKARCCTIERSLHCDLPDLM